MATSLDALEALLQFRDGAPKRPFQSHANHPDLPVPNPLDPTQPHIIEGDASSPTSRHVYKFGSGTRSAFTPKPTLASAPIVTTVPNPLAAPVAKEHSSQHSVSHPNTPASSQIKSVTHGFLMNPDLAGSSSVHTDDAKPRPAKIELSTDKIREAINSKPQRGKKRKNLSDDERLELTRTRNREHAKSTRMKKKARLEELLDIESKYKLVKARQALELSRKQGLVKFVETISKHSPATRDCPHSSELNQLASQVIQSPEFSVAGAVALTSENSGAVKISAHGSDLESGKQTALSGVICVDFVSNTSGISSVSLHWSTLRGNLSSVGMFPSISLLSFEPDCTTSSDL